MSKRKFINVWNGIPLTYLGCIDIHSEEFLSLDTELNFLQKDLIFELSKLDFSNEYDADLTLYLEKREIFNERAKAVLLTIGCVAERADMAWPPD